MKSSCQYHNNPNENNHIINHITSHIYSRKTMTSTRRNVMHSTMRVMLLLLILFCTSPLVHSIQSTSRIAMDERRVKSTKYTPNPTRRPTPRPSPPPTPVSPTLAPSVAPTRGPSAAPFAAPTKNPTLAPVTTFSPTTFPTLAPVVTETSSPTSAPVVATTNSPTLAPVVSETESPTSAPVETQTDSPTAAPVITETDSPTLAPIGTTETITSSPVVSSTASPTAAPVSAVTSSPTPETATATASLTTLDLPIVRVTAATDTVLDTDRATLVTNQVADFLTAGLNQDQPDWKLRTLTLEHSFPARALRTLQEGTEILLQGQATLEQAPPRDELWNYIRNHMDSWDQVEWDTWVQETTQERSAPVLATAVESGESNSSTTTVVASTMGVSALVLLVAVFVYRKRQTKKDADKHSLFTSFEATDSVFMSKAADIPDVMTLGISATGSFSNNDSSSDNSSEEDQGEYRMAQELPCLREERQSDIDEEATTASRANSAHTFDLEDHIVDAGSMILEDIDLENSHDFLMSALVVPSSSSAYSTSSTSSTEPQVKVLFEDESQHDLMSLSSPSASICNDVGTEDGSNSMAATEVAVNKWLHSSSPRGMLLPERSNPEADPEDSDCTFEYSSDKECQLELSASGEMSVVRGSSSSNLLGSIPSSPTSISSEQTPTGNVDRYFNDYDDPTLNTSQSSGASSMDDEKLFTLGTTKSVLGSPVHDSVEVGQDADLELMAAAKTPPTKNKKGLVPGSAQSAVVTPDQESPSSPVSLRKSVSPEDKNAKKESPPPARTLPLLARMAEPSRRKKNASYRVWI